VSGTGRRRKPNPDEEGNLPAPPRPPAGYSPPPPQPEYDYAYDWRTPPAAQPDPQPGPGPTFDPFSSSGATSPEQSGSYYNPVGHGLQDPYSAAAYAPSPSVAPPTQPPQPQSTPPRQPDPPSFPRQPSPASYAPPPYSPPSPAPASSRPAAPAPAPDVGGLFDENDLFDTGSSPVPAAPAAPVSAAPRPEASLSATGTSPVVPPPSADAPRPQDGYMAADFAFLEEETGQDVNSWLTFVESRAESRADRIKQFRRRFIGIGVVVALVAAGIGGYFLFNGGPLGAKPVTKSVILLQVSDSTGSAVADALLVTDRSATSGTGASKTVTGKGAAVLIPSQMVVNTIGFGAQPFGGVAAQNIPAAGKETVADTLGVTIDGVWRMDKITFAGLIDELGGVQVTTNTAVPATTASPTAAAVPAGTQKLTGAQAVSYGTYSAKGESATAQSGRFGQVVSALLAALPSDAAAITAYLNHLGIVDDPSLPESKLSPILAALSAQDQAGAFTATVLPLRTDGSNALDTQAAAPIVSGLLGGALAAVSPGQVSRVLVEDASGHTGAQSQAIRGTAQARLTNNGYSFIDGSTVARRATSVVEAGSADQKSAAVQIAQSLGLQASNVQVVSGLSSLGDVTVVLGEDWPSLAGVTLPSVTVSASAAG
jgi:anionic cell wall polymer biosynthesis LytR-Cps2A-Psr (LCP) family protein